MSRAIPPTMNSPRPEPPTSPFVVNFSGTGLAQPPATFTFDNGPLNIAIPDGNLTGITNSITSFLGGTGLLIVISVCLDLIQKIDSHLVMRNYSGLLEP